MAVLAVAFAWPVSAQSGRIAGTVRTVTGEPLGNARIFVASSATAALSRADGSFMIPSVPAGTQELRVFHIGFRTATVSGIVVRDGEESRVAAQLEPTAVMLDAVVASVSRHAETITDAPAAVTFFDAATIGKGLGSPFVRLLARAPGIDITQVGVMSSFVNGRGFNRVFNSRWLTIEDGRVAMFAETSLPIGEHTTIPKIDIADMEAIAGPGSALYGANASGGVLSVTTKSPRLYPGAAIEASGGSQYYRDVQGRYAGTSGNWGYKITGQHQAAREWADAVTYSPVTPGGPVLPEVGRSPDTRATRVSGSLQYDLTEDAHLALNAGFSSRDALGQTTNGRYQIDGYRYDDVHLLARGSRWFAQAYQTHSNSGDTYRLNVLTQTQAAAPGISADSARSIAAFPVDGRIRAVELQHNLPIGAALHTGLRFVDETRVTWGLQARQDHVETYQRLYTDAADGRAIHADHGALYVQVESRPVGSLRLVGAARYDSHSDFPSRWSPKFGVLHNVGPTRVVRLTFNGAYLAPSIFQSDLYALSAAAGFVTHGNRHGFDIRDGSGALVSSVPAIRPEENQTWEAGFKGELSRRLFVDATLYFSRFREFMTVTGPIANPSAASPTFAFSQKTGERVEDAAGNPLRVFTFINSGKGDFGGLDAALRYRVTERLFMSTSTSLTGALATEDHATAPPEATAFNTSAHRSSLGIEYAASPFEAGLRTRYVKGYDFRSGADYGHIPSFGTLGLSASYRLATLGTTVLLQADNIFACVGGTVTPPAAGISAAAAPFTYVPGRSCRIGLRHRELLNMPAIGPMVFLGLRRDWF